MKASCSLSTVSLQCTFGAFSPSELCKSDFTYFELGKPWEEAGKSMSRQSTSVPPTADHLQWWSRLGKGASLVCMDAPAATAEWGTGVTS